MKWQATINDKNILLELPSQIPEGLSFKAKIDGAEETLIWHSSRRILTKITNGLEQNIPIRNISAQKFAGEVSTNIQASSWLSSNAKNTEARMSYLSFEVEPYIPGSAKRAKAKVQAGYVIRSQITGKILSVNCKKGDKVNAGDTILVIEAMKMENKIFAPATGVITKLTATADTAVTVGAELARIE